eukprot:gnl/TRDRNA2_/TRDRNA2_185525_c0_seq1.p1 gnl/TRDRNA2_/TRDRNA2_185525_c0~~gnl/TRDRNA2_/TRDRNA2_185525_c0_seq1.p1  ORF type:complete len:180 (+),score=43.43 gnl/TRDRNA2_/TRDRNA2_185525_c0_seq1:114-653(+)
MPTMAAAATCDIDCWHGAEQLPPLMRQAPCRSASCRAAFLGEDAPLRRLPYLPPRCPSAFFVQAHSLTSFAAQDPQHDPSGGAVWIATTCPGPKKAGAGHVDENGVVHLGRPSGLGRLFLGGIVLGGVGGAGVKIAKKVQQKREQRQKELEEQQLAEGLGQDEEGDDGNTGRQEDSEDD